MMALRIIYIYCLCDEFLKTTALKNDPQSKMTHAEIMTFGMTAALYFGGNFAKTRLFFLSHHYFNNVISKSKINKKLHYIPYEIWMQVFYIFRTVTSCPQASEFIVDSFPVPVCQNARTWRCRLFSQKTHHGYCASKKTYYWGLKVHMLVTSEGFPYEFFFSAASMPDVVALDYMHLDIPAGSTVYADRGYNSYQREDFLREAGIDLVVQRKQNSKRPHTASKAYLQQVNRKRIETTFSGITSYLPRRIHATSAKGFYLKLLLFILAYCAETAN
jgi:Transposase DDE domain